MKLRNVLLLVSLPLGLVVPVLTIPYADAQTETILHSFGASSSNGRGPVAGLVQGSDGNFYGTTEIGGKYNRGTVFSVSAGGTYTTLYSFAGYPNDGANPYAGLVHGVDGNFYGTTYAGGASNWGAVFKFSPSGTCTSLYSFGVSPNDGKRPRAGLVQDSDGNYYGTTSGGGHDSGTVFRISPTGSYTNLYAFGGSSTDGAGPWAGLIQGSDGGFYGTTVSGGTYRVDTVFRISPSGTFTSLHSFGGPYGVYYVDGKYPQAGLAQGSDGNFYGTTTAGGGDGAGNVFRISPTGNYANLRFFGWINNGSGANEDGSIANGLIQGSDGNFYGTTAQGGTNKVGTVFRINPIPFAGTTNYPYAILYEFGGSQGDGREPYAGLVQGSDGTFYGTTLAGSPNLSQYGTMFKLSVPLNPPANQGLAIQWSDKMSILRRSAPTRRSGVLCCLVLWIPIWVLLACCLSPANADTVTLNSGEVLHGRILSETDTNLVIEASFYHGTILSTREVLKSDTQSIIHETAEQKQATADYEALASFTLNPNQELTKDQYDAGIAAFEKFLTTDTNSSYAADIDHRLADWRAEVSNVESGKVKFAGTWMTPDEKRTEAAQNTMQSLKQQLADLQRQRIAQAEKLVATQKQLTDAQTRLAKISDAAGSASGSTGNQGGRRDLAGRLTAGVVGVSQGENAAEPVSNPERSQLQAEIGSDREQVIQQQGSLAMLDQKIAEVQSQVSPSEQTYNSALAQSSETNHRDRASVTRTNETVAPAKTPSSAAPAAEQIPPWYMRAWKWFHG